MPNPVTPCTVILAALLATPCAVATHLLITYWLEPYRTYRDLKYKIAADLIFYDNAVEIGEHDNDTPIFKKKLEREAVIRRHASSLEVAYHQLPLPQWASAIVTVSRENITKAHDLLIKLSNVDKREEERNSRRELRDILGSPF